MLQQSTQVSGITAGHDTPYRLLTVDLPYFAPLRDQDLRCLVKGAPGTTSLNTPSSWRAASSLLFGRELPAFFSLRFRAFGRIHFALAVRFAIPLRFLASLPSQFALLHLRRRTKVASPTVAPWGHSCSSERLWPRLTRERSRGL